MYICKILLHSDSHYLRNLLRKTAAAAAILFSVLELVDAAFIMESIVTVADLQQRFEGVYEPQFVLHYYANWYSSEVAIISEKMMSDGYV